MIRKLFLVSIRVALFSIFLAIGAKAFATSSVTTREPNSQISVGYQKGRRELFRASFGIVTSWSLPIDPADAGFFDAKDRRQLEFCLVNLLRLQCWAENIFDEIRETESENRQKELYLEARLGAKAAVTGRIGGGANSKVYMLSSLQLRDTLDDLSWYAAKEKNKNAIELKDDLIEGLAALVEFDGLETTQDPSPRSSLMLSMFNEKKLTFVSRMLNERIVPTSKSLFRSFDSETQNRCMTYFQSTYPNELPKHTIAAAAPQ